MGQVDRVKQLSAVNIADIEVKAVESCKELKLRYGGMVLQDKRIILQALNVQVTATTREMKIKFSVVLGRTKIEWSHEEASHQISIKKGSISAPPSLN